ncbi:hypothetical protein J6590_101598, partial [Homalodisca vitripennis]
LPLLDAGHMSDIYVPAPANGLGDAATGEGCAVSTVDPEACQGPPVGAVPRTQGADDEGIHGSLVSSGRQHPPEY